MKKKQQSFCLHLKLLCGLLLPVAPAFFVFLSFINPVITDGQVNAVGKKEPGQQAEKLKEKNTDWIKADNGLYIGEFNSSQKSITGDSEITIIKINPELYSFQLLCAGELHHSNLTAKEWCKKYNLIGAVNAGMFQADDKSNVGYMKNYNYKNNSRINSYFSVAAFNPADPAKNSPFRIFDKDAYKMEDVIRDYNTVIQNLRLIKRPSMNQWSQQPNKWSEVALGQDKDGNVLFIFSRSPYSMHDFINVLLKLPIGIVCAQHLEGGPEASLYFSDGKITIEKNGSYETGFWENDNNSLFWPIPNIIGFMKK